MSSGVRRTIALVRDITPDLELRERLALHVMIQSRSDHRRSQYEGRLRQCHFHRHVRP
jgi:hypothetical protein